MSVERKLFMLLQQGQGFEFKDISQPVQRSSSSVAILDMLAYVDLGRQSNVSTLTLHISATMNATLTCSTTAVALKNGSAFTSRYHNVYEGTRCLYVAWAHYAYALAQM